MNNTLVKIRKWICGCQVSIELSALECGRYRFDNHPRLCKPGYCLCSLPHFYSKSEGLCLINRKRQLTHAVSPLSHSKVSVSSSGLLLTAEETPSTLRISMDTAPKSKAVPRHFTLPKTLRIWLQSISLCGIYGFCRFAVCTAEECGRRKLSLFRCGGASRALHSAQVLRWFRDRGLWKSYVHARLPSPIFATDILSIPSTAVCTPLTLRVLH